MANGANRIFRIMQNTNVNTISEYIPLRVTSVNPLTLTDDDKLILTGEFCQFNEEIDTSKISVGDVFNAVTLNDNQTYLINDVNRSKNQLLKYNNSIQEIRTICLQLQTKITELESTISSLDARVKELEEKQGGE